MDQAADESPTQVNPAPPGAGASVQPSGITAAPGGAPPAAPAARPRRWRVVPLEVNLRLLVIAVALMVALLFFAWSNGRRPPAQAPITEGTRAPRLSDPSTRRAPRTVCGWCDGDGTIDESDRRRLAPTTNAEPGTCPYCQGKDREE